MERTNNATALRVVKIPDSITTINSSAFLGCASLQKIYFSDNITYIGNYAFNDCTSLKTVNLPDSLI